MKHTPGPWMIKGESFVASTVIMTENVYDDGCHYVVAKAGAESSYIGLNYKERAANAKLIAAAPDLLMAAISASDLLKWVIDNAPSEHAKIAKEKLDAA